eukprot:6915621-Lingulodinium_polyedra.AAC.1
MELAITASRRACSSYCRPALATLFSREDGQCSPMELLVAPPGLGGRPFHELELALETVHLLFTHLVA